MHKPVVSQKRYIVRKYVMAKSAQEAMRLEKKFKVDDVWLDDKWLEAQTRTADAVSDMGFTHGDQGKSGE